MTWDVIATATGIGAGAVVMLVSVLRFGGIMARAEYIQGEERGELLRYLGIHRLLMSFFLVGYVVVLGGILTDRLAMGNLIVSGVFLFGAIFVYIGLQLQDRMLAGVIAQADQAIAQQEAREQAKAAQEALGRERDISRLKEEFLASLNHELRTPLNAILGLSEALQEDVYGPLQDKQRESLGTIEGSGRKLLGMIDDLLDFSRIGAGRYSTQVSPGDLRSTVRSVARRHLRSVANKSLKLEIDEGHGEQNILTDMRHVQLILDILLDNAIKFTPEGGRVGLSLQEIEDNDQVEVSVWDTGIGFPEDRLATLFEPFVQVQGGLSRRYGGTGLGLALTSRLSRLLGAELRVESTPDHGSRFTLRLPRGMPYRLRVYADLRCPFCY
ncbi:MAG: HAMP domain-containing sensor histidine kinase, partial [Myxococcota bacterium]|nr:HAMP domain-containing sensor histidine kinase [Myxococcota bacterium]